MVYGEDMLKPETVYKWAKHFQERHEDINDNTWSGRPSSCTEENVDQAHVLITNGQIMTIELLKCLHKHIQ